jgi:hypothetical protein
MDLLMIDLEPTELDVLLRHARRIADDDTRDQFFSYVADQLRDQRVTTSLLHAAVHAARATLGIGGQVIAGPPGPIPYTGGQGAASR